MSACGLKGTKLGDWLIVSADDDHFTSLDLIEIAGKWVLDS